MNKRWLKAKTFILPDSLEFKESIDEPRETRLPAARCCAS